LPVHQNFLRSKPCDPRNELCRTALACFTAFCGVQTSLRVASTTLYSINSQFKAAYCRINIFSKSLSLNFFNWIAIALMAYGFGSADVHSQSAAKHPSNFPDAPLWKIKISNVGLIIL
jgi:hypothetical protein